MCKTACNNKGCSPYDHQDSMTKQNFICIEKYLLSIKNCFDIKSLKEKQISQFLQTERQK